VRRLQVSTENGTTTVRFDEPGKQLTIALPYGETSWVRITAVGTDDGSYGRKWLVTEPVKELCEAGKLNRVVAIGPIPMMKFTSKATQPFGVTTIVSLNPVMVDGTGMCGACRVSVGGATRFVCIDGPDFDGHKVNWDELSARNQIYRENEKLAMELWQCESCADETK